MLAIYIWNINSVFANTTTVIITVERKEKQKLICLLYFLIAGLTLSHAGVSLQTTAGKSGSTMMQNASTTESIAHIVGQHTPLSGLTPIVTPMTVVSQGNQVTAHILAPSSLAGKMITTPILKSVGQMPLVNAQYLNTTTLVKPVVVVSSSTTTLPSTTASSTQPPSTSNSTVWRYQGKTKLIWSCWNVKIWIVGIFNQSLYVLK